MDYDEEKEEINRSCVFAFICRTEESMPITSKLRNGVGGVTCISELPFTNTLEVPFPVRYIRVRWHGAVHRLEFFDAAPPAVDFYLLTHCPAILTLYLDGVGKIVVPSSGVFSGQQRLANADSPFASSASIASSQVERMIQLPRPVMLKGCEITAQARYNVPGGAVVGEDYVTQDNEVLYSEFSIECFENMPL